MVYCGKPSTGCQNCKNRRIKCDETRPHCQNCTRTNRACPGFPSKVDLIFRSENPGVPRKARKTTKPGGGSTQPDTAIDDEEVYDDPNSPDSRKRRRRDTQTSSSIDDNSSTASQGYSPSNNLMHLERSNRFAPTVEQQATTAFLQNYVSGHQHTNSTRGYLDVIAAIFDRVMTDSPLHLAVEALSLSLMSHAPERNHWAQRAARSYGRALAATSTAIQNPQEATSDATLLTILLFAFYESLTMSEHAMSACSKHIDGAVAITKARGVKQFRDPQSLLLFRAVRTQMLANAVRQQKPVDEFPGPRGWLSDLPAGNAGALKVVESSMSLPNLLSAAKSLLARERTAENIPEVYLLLEQAVEIQQAHVAWESYMPSDWGYAVRGMSQSMDVDNIDELEAWPGPIHSYRDIQVATIRNNNRVDQLYCASTIIAALKWLDPDGYINDLRYGMARDRVQTLVNEICYSVPFLLQPQQFGDGSQIDSPVGDFGGHLVLWPAYVAWYVEGISDLQRRWLQGRLKSVAWRLGMVCSNAGAVSDASRKSSASGQSHSGSQSGLREDVYARLTYSEPHDRKDSHSPMMMHFEYPVDYHHHDTTMAIDPVLLAPECLTPQLGDISSYSCFDYGQLGLVTAS